MTIEPPFILLSTKIEEHKNEIVLLEYQIANLTKPEKHTYERLFKEYQDNIFNPYCISRENFFLLCKQMMHYYTLQEKIKKKKEDLSKLYMMYIDETLPIVSKMDLN